MADSPVGRWQPGQSGNPAGRPRGKKNELTELQQELELAVRKSIKSERVVAIVEKLVTMAENGDVKAAKLILDKVIPNASSNDDAPDGQGGIVIRIENATFAHQTNPVEVIDVTPTEEPNVNRS
jgi:hypothetical protein